MGTTKELAEVIFVHPDGTQESVIDLQGRSVMDFAVDHGIAGIEAQCGGACICSTCHCLIDSSWSDLVEPAQCDELEMLEYTPARQAASRLSCQIEVTGSIDGLIVHIIREEKEVEK